LISHNGEVCRCVYDNMLKHILLVGVGGGLGSILRYLTSVVAVRYYDEAFPLATFAVNVIGCFVMGLLTGMPGMLTQEARLLFVAGFCGGFTTFSAFAFENVRLLQGNSHLTAFFYIGLSVLAGLIGVWLGLQAARQL
jgi:CrcB protein